jgi:hypothetical protein
MYTREAVCLNVPGKGLKATEEAETEEETTTTVPTGNEDVGEPKVEAADLKPEIKSIVHKMVTKSVR